MYIDIHHSTCTGRLEPRGLRKPELGGGGQSSDRGRWGRGESRQGDLVLTGMPGGRVEPARSQHPSSMYILTIIKSTAH